MRRHMNINKFFSLLIFAFALQVVASAQTITLNDEVARPVPGVGHDYVKGLNETINPANGSLNITIDLPTPADRGFTMPFALTYNSGEAHHFTLGTQIGSGGLDCSSGCLTASMFTDRSQAGYGWADTMPYTVVSVGVFQINLYPEYQGPYCTTTQNYNFYDVEGGSHSLGLSAIGSQFVGPNSPPPVSIPGLCTAPADSIIPLTTDFPIHAASKIGGDDQVVGEMDALCSGVANGAGSDDCEFAQPAFTVTDRAANKYIYPDNYTGYSQGGSYTDFIFPAMIEDRNGNQIDFIPYSAGSTLEPSVTDSTHRDIIAPTYTTFTSINGVTLASPTPLITQYEVGGQTYTIAYTTTSASYNANATEYYPFGNTSSTQACNGVFTVNTTARPVIQYITLPNGQRYHFGYDATFGLVNEITYPDGGSVSYTWGLSNTPAVDATFDGLTSTQIIYDGSLTPVTAYYPVANLCNYQYYTPVIKERQLAYSAGASPALAQTFAYSTIWNSNEYQWNTKQTTVTTTDNITGKTSKRVYNYTPYLIYPGPNSEQTALPTQISVESSVVDYDWGSSTPIKTVQKSWNDQYQLSSESTTLNTKNSSLTSSVNYTYSNATSNTGQPGFPAAIILKQEYDYSNKLTRQTAYTYFTINGPCLFYLNTAPSSMDCNNTPITFGLYKSAPVVPCQIVTKDGAGNWISETDAYYDYDSTLCGSSSPGTMSAIQGPTLIANTHDNANYGTTLPAATAASPNPITRGNLTSLVKWINQSTSETDSLTYDITGKVLSRTYGCGNSTCSDMLAGGHTYTYSYNDQYASGSPSGNTNAYLTQITYPTVNGITREEQFTYNYTSGELATYLDVNNNAKTSYGYDAYYRLILSTYPDGGQASVCYQDVSGDSCSNTVVPSITTTQRLNNSKSKVSTAIRDGLGHVIEDAVTDNAGDDTLIVDTKYDGTGHVFTKTNPYRGSEGSPTAASTNGTTTSYYDALGRPIETVEPDGSILQTCYNGQPSVPAVSICSSAELGSTAAPYVSGSTESMNFAGSWVDSTDESSNHWQRTSDAFGRLVQVMEPSATSQTPTMQTNYAYDTLNNLTGITQWGGSAGSSTSAAVTRTFTYDSLSRLTQSNNPESGQINYYYDLNNNLAYKTSPAVNQAAGNTQNIYYCYDALNRIAFKFAPDSSAPSCTSPTGYTESYTYDTSSISGATNDVGRLTDQKSYIGGTLVSDSSPYSYDTMGRLLIEQQIPYSPLGPIYTFDYGYDLAGDLNMATNGLPSTSTAPLTFNYTYDGLARLSTATTTQPSSWNTTTYPTTIFSATPETTPLELSTSSYDPMGHLVNAAFSETTAGATPSLIINRAYDSRGRIFEEFDYGAGTTTPTKSTGSIGIAGVEKLYPVSAQSATSGTGGFSVNIMAVNSSGAISVTVNGILLSYSFSSTQSNLNAGTISQGLIAAINADSSIPVTASGGGSGSTFGISLTAKTTGTASNYSMSASCSGACSILGAPSALSGGKNASGACYSYDTGTITAQVNGISATAAWGQSSNTSSLATALAASLNSLGSSFVTAKASGPDVYLISTSTGNAVDWPVSMTYTDTNSKFSSTPSFYDAGEGMGGSEGMEGGDSSTLYSYVVPEGGYAANGNLLTYQDSVMGNWNFTYDGLNRLTGSQNTATTTAGAQYANVTGCWGYDGFGNRTAETYSNTASSPCANGSSAPILQAVTTPLPAMNNRISGLTYDGAGNVIVDPYNQYLYDAEGRICVVKNLASGQYTEYVYDAAGTRVAKGTLSGYTSLPSTCPAPTMANGFTLTAQYLLGPGGEQVTELDGSGNWKHTNAWQGGHLTVTYDPQGEHYYIADPLGTKRIQASASGSAELYCLTLPWGNSFDNTNYADCVSANGTYQGTDGATEHNFTGKERDTESGNDYFGARYYASTMGRFLSPDPQYVQERMVKDPQSWNLYTYGRNNPLSFIDPNGEAILLPGDDDQRKKALAALQSAVGKQAGSYLYDNAVTDKNGNVQHYVGIYTNGPDGKSADFASINAVSKEVSQIIGSQDVAALRVVRMGDSLPGRPFGKDQSLSEQGAWGITYPGKTINVYVPDPSDKLDPVEGWKMSNGLPGIRTLDTVTGHELGHAWGFMQGIGNDNLNNKQALDLENKVRTLKNPSAPTRTEH